MFLGCEFLPWIGMLWERYMPATHCMQKSKMSVLENTLWGFQCLLQYKQIVYGLHFIHLLECIKSTLTKPPTTMITNVTVANPVDLIQLKLRKCYCWYLIDRGYISVWLEPLLAAWNDFNKDSEAHNHDGSKFLSNAVVPLKEKLSKIYTKMETISIKQFFTLQENR